MLLKTVTSVAALALLLGASSVLAQSTTPQRPTPTPPSAREAPKAPVAGQIVVQDGNTLLAREFIGQTVYAPDKTKIGTISDLILTRDGKTVEGFVIGVGGFLGIGEKSVALKIDGLQIMPDPQTGAVALMMDAKKEELASTPSFKSRRDQDSERQSMERARNQPQGGGMTKPEKN
jgi:sporulation protein YlmC with PRC-barrel domain